MHTVHSLLLNLHIGIGMIAIALFWAPLATRKGSRWHVRAGQWYVYSMYAVSATAFVMCLMVLTDPVGVRAPSRNLDPAAAYRLKANAQVFAAFLLMLSLLVFSAARHGLLALRTRKEPRIMARPTHRLLLGAMGVTSIVVGLQGIATTQILLMVFAVLGLSGSIRMLRETARATWSRSEAIVAHLNGLIGTGIGAYTAVFAFGGSRLFQELLPGQWQVIPWITPAIVGTFATAWLERRYGGPKAQKKTMEPAGRTPVTNPVKA
ncbi:MAG: hypothetical protein AAGF46_08060 [Pseudomonadota bacterium]